jgi:hypothetical protein
VVFERKDEKKVQVCDVHDDNHGVAWDLMSSPHHHVLICFSSHSHRSQDRRAMKLNQQPKRSKLLSMAQPVQPKEPPQSLYIHFKTNVVGVRRVRGHHDIGVRSEVSSRQTLCVRRAPVPPSLKRQHHTRSPRPYTSCGSESDSSVSDGPVIASTVDFTPFSGLDAAETGKSIDM